MLLRALIISFSVLLTACDTPSTTDAGVDAGTSGTGGGSAGPSTCSVATDCPATGEECTTRTCVDGVCGTAPVAAGTVRASQTVGDCQARVCDGQGGTMSVADNTDKPFSQPCRAATCVAGVPSFTTFDAGTSCGATTVCDGTGLCVGCVKASDCPGTGTLCGVKACINRVCTLAAVDAGVVPTAQVAGDCTELICDGDGGARAVPLDADVRDDGNPCTDDACMGGQERHTPKVANASCSANGNVCNGDGGCVQCVTAANCSGTDSECSQRACVAGTCRRANAPRATATTTQTAGDCQQTQCDGDGGVMSVALNTDVLDAGSACLVTGCQNGQPTSTNADAGLTCGASLFCNGNGSCIGCVTPLTCPGQDSECQTRTCVSGSCGFAFADAGTPTSTQLAGDCRQNQCNGSGAIVSAALDADLPVDNTPCTRDVCMNGVASNPPATAATVCAQNGGVLCDGAGACVQCLVANDCSGTDTACRTRTCVTGQCGTSFAAAGPTATQTPGDCRRSECNGAGGLVNAVDDTDVPNDNNQCTSDVCMAGSASNSPLPALTMCTQNGGSVCNASGACVACTVDSQCSTGACRAGACVTLNGCSLATAMDMTGGAPTTVTFPNGNFTYSPSCLKVSVGTQVTFSGSFASHPLQGGDVVGGVQTPAASGPFVPVTNSGTSKTVTMSSVGAFPYYCVPHGSIGMNGAVFVVP